MRELRRLLAAQAVVLVLGAGLIWWFATPLAEQASGLDSMDWGWLIGYAAFWGVLAGVIEGLVLGRGRLAGALLTAVLVAPFALWVPMFLVSDLGPDGTEIRTDPADLLGALAGWASYTLIGALVASTLGLLLRRTSYATSPAVPRRVALIAVVVVVVGLLVWLAALS